MTDSTIAKLEIIRAAKEIQALIDAKECEIKRPQRRQSIKIQKVKFQHRLR